jgi:hypothetical protein
MTSTLILHLNLHREHFAAIVAGTKRIEYRDQTQYWRSRLEGRTYDVIQFRNGYAANASAFAKATARQASDDRQISWSATVWAWARGVLCHPFGEGVEDRSISINAVAQRLVG